MMLIRLFIFFLLGVFDAQAENNGAVHWISDFSLGLTTFGQNVPMWGGENLSILREGETNFLRVNIPKSTFDPASMRRLGRPLGGAGFKTQFCGGGKRSGVLTYSLRFDPSMDFVLGGKLPGLYGGQGNSGGVAADGTNGFSFRYMWGMEGRGGSIYAYLPSKSAWGLPMFGGQLKFKKGVWQELRQELVLNTPGLSDGVLRVWLDGKLVGSTENLLVRTVETLGVSGLFFDVFFGGGSQEWASKSDVYIDFKNFSLRCW